VTVVNHEHHDLREEILERIWNLSEAGEHAATVQPLLALAPEDEVRAELERLRASGSIRLEEDRLRLTPDGEAVARHVVRAHRLAARLLADLLELPEEMVEHQACRLEHAISPEVADSICTLLGHPPTSPAGRAIPPGRCCEANRTEVGQVVHPLTELDLGAHARIAFLRSRLSERVSQLGVLGLTPGAELHLRQLHPSVVVQLGETTVALDREVAQEIHVKPVT
jgi:DtxR family Mn-dependent transcriptional regulator